MHCEEPNRSNVVIDGKTISLVGPATMMHVWQAMKEAENETDPLGN